MAATRHVFCYGSLMFAEVWCRVVQGHYATQPGWICGYQRRRVQGELFPCLIPGADHDRVHGVIYEQHPQSTRRNVLPVKLIDGTLVMCHEHLTGALI